MKLSLIIAGILIVVVLACTVFAQTSKGKDSCTGEDACYKKTQSKENRSFSCKLTTPELRQRKETVIRSLKNKILEKKELTDGYQYKFDGADVVLDELTEFVKTERACCDFFNFTLVVSGDAKRATLDITGPEGVKEFIRTELEM